MLFLVGPIFQHLFVGNPDIFLSRTTPVQKQMN
jgi:hypothetical protein